MATVQRLQRSAKRVRPERQMQDVLLLHDNARPHTSLRTTAANTKLRRTAAPPTTSDFHLLGPTNNAIRGRKFGDGDEVAEEAKTWIRETPEDFRQQRIQGLICRWQESRRNGWRLSGKTLLVNKARNYSYAKFHLFAII